MAQYVIGDLQGCYDPFRRLLDKIDFDPARDRLWLTGDLVNRGPKSRKTLRFVKKLGSAAISVLGNHDLHLLAVASGLRKKGRSDTLDRLLTAHDRDELLHWLRHRPLLHRENGFTMVHAGIPHIWSIKQAASYATEVEAALRGPEWRKFLARMYGNTPRRWRDDLVGYPRLRTITNYLTRMRFVYANGQLDLQSKGLTPNRGRAVAPWFSYEERETRGQNIIFGHWAALQGEVQGDHLFAMDTGCVWGNQLSMVCLESGEWYRCNCS